MYVHVLFCDIKIIAATRTTTSTAAPHMIIRVSMRHQRRLECSSFSLANLSARIFHTISSSRRNGAFAGVHSAIPPTTTLNQGVSCV